MELNIVYILDMVYAMSVKIIIIIINMIKDVNILMMMIINLKIVNMEMKMNIANIAKIIFI